MRGSRLRIVSAKKQSLGSVLNHSAIPGLVRHLFGSSEILGSGPLHIAVHHYDGTGPRGAKGQFRYSQLHSHSTYEMDCLVPLSRDFAVQVESEHEVRLVRGYKNVVVPAGVDHRIEYVSGSGVLICIVGVADYPSTLL